MHCPAHLSISPGLPLASSGLPGREWDEAKDALWGGPLLGAGAQVPRAEPGRGLQSPRCGAVRAQLAPCAQGPGGRGDETRGLAACTAVGTRDRAQRVGLVLHSPCPVLQAVCAGGVQQVLMWGGSFIFLFEERQMGKMG